METSTFQAAKLAIVGATGLSKDALHIHVGLAVYLAGRFVFRKRPRAHAPVLLALLAACVGEVLDMRDDTLSLGHWRWGASLHDVINTVWWPVVLHLLTSRRAAAGSDRS